ncbi:MAG: PIN domain-containing protein [Candidatus Marinimicrobia bacterium]|nr:PIN domain-containing protein [Candidatus Neomarinimicrobiota bacterium]
MQKIFIDTDIILDLLAERQPFYKNAAAIFTLIDRGKVKGFTSPIVFANLHYILSKQLSQKYAIQNLKKLRTLIKIVPVDERIIDLSLESDFKDYEDAIQYNAAISAGISTLITRNIKDYKNPTITVCSPDEYLRVWSTQNK